MKKEIIANEVNAAPQILSQAVEANGFVFVSGQVPIKLDGTMVETNVKDKLSQIMTNIASILNVADMTMNNIVKVTIYVTDMAQMPEINQYYPTYFTAPLPAREAICVAALPLGATIEISVIAAR